MDISNNSCKEHHLFCHEILEAFWSIGLKKKSSKTKIGILHQSYKWNEFEHCALKLLSGNGPAELVTKKF